MKISSKLFRYGGTAIFNISISLISKSSKFIQQKLKNFQQSKLWKTANYESIIE